MKKRIVVFGILISIMMCIFSINLWAEEKSYYKLSAEQTYEVVSDQKAKFGMIYAGGSSRFDLFTYDETHDLIVYDEDLYQAYVIEKHGDNILTFPADEDNLQLFMIRSDKTNTGRAYGYMGKDGNIIVEPIYELGDVMVGGVGLLGHFDDDNSPTYTIFDKKGKKLIENDLKDIGRFILPKTLVGISQSTYTFDYFRSDYLQDYTPVKYASFLEEAPNPVMVASTGRGRKYPRYHHIVVDAKKGIMDNKGNILQKPIYIEVNVGDNDIIAVAKERWNWGYINPEGKVLLPLEYNFVSRFRNGRAAIVKKFDINDYRIAFINEQFEIIQDYKKAPYWLDFYRIGAVDEIRMAYDDDEDIGCSKWSKEYILLANALEIVPENLKNMYNENINREDFCKMLINAIYRNTLNEDMYYGNVQSRLLLEAALKIENQGNPFTDTDSVEVQLAYYMGVVKGRDDGKFDPDGKINREQASTMLMRAYTLCLPNKKFASREYEEDCLQYDYRDYKEVSEWAAEMVYYAKERSIMEGIGKPIRNDKLHRNLDEFNPKGTYTVEQAITTIIRLYENL